MKNGGIVLCLVGLIVVLLGCGESERPRLTALFVSDMGYSEADIRALTSAFQKEHRQIEVSAFFVPHESQRNAILMFGASRAQGYDVVALDGAWTAEFVEGDFLVDVTNRLHNEPTSDIFPFAMEAFTQNGKRYAMPWVTDCEYLFFNRKMLNAAGVNSPPRTWEELRAQAKTIKDKGIVRYPIIAQWGHDDDVVCDFACMLFARGGEFLNSKGQPAFAEASGVESLGFMKKLLDEGLVNPASLEARSDDARRILCEGQAAFNLNWFYVWDLANDPKLSKVAGQLEMTLAPGGKNTRSASVNRSIGLGVMASSQMPDIAWEYCRFIGSKENQKKYCRITLPVYRSLYDDAALSGTPLGVAHKTAKEQYDYVHARPGVFYYRKISMTLQDEIEVALEGKKEPAVALAAAAVKLKDAAKDKPGYKR